MHWMTWRAIFLIPTSPDVDAADHGQSASTGCARVCVVKDAKSPANHRAFSDAQTAAGRQRTVHGGRRVPRVTAHHPPRCLQVTARRHRQPGTDTRPLFGSK
jgi:hypothetical protein